jgi:hypothetical protein
VSSISTDHPFCAKHEDKIRGILSCFDRVIFRGYLPLSYPEGLSAFMWRQNVPLKEFKNYAPQIAERIKNHVITTVAKAGAPYRYLPTKVRMEEEARALVKAKAIREGIVCAFSQSETCRTFAFEYRDGRPRLKRDFRRFLVMYVFLLHPVLGLIHVKIHTWLPLTMQVYVNGHDFLAKKLDGLGIKYTLQDNAFTSLADPKAAQKCAERFAKQNWPKLLGELAGQFNPLVGREVRKQEYYWVMDQAEFATDVLFRDPSALAGFYPRLVEHARACLSAEDVLKFLGRKLNANFRGEVQTHVSRRLEGVRVVHRMKSNKLKMYDKGGIVLRIETTINDPTEFRVRRKKAKGNGMEWQPLRKGVAWLWRYAEVSRSANRRYLEALAVVNDDSAARKLLDRVTQPAKLNGHNRRALQPLSPADQQLFLAVMQGEHRLRGFRNQDIARYFYAAPTHDPLARHRRCGRVTRLIQLLRAHHLVARIPRTRRYRITVQGELLMSAAIKAKHIDLPKHISDAA